MKKLLPLLILILFCSVCLPTFAKQQTNAIITPQTQLEKRQYQTRQFSNVKKDTVMKAMLNVLQDDSFIVNNANPTLGFISGAKEFSVNDKTINFQQEFGAKKVSGAIVAVVEATANVSEFGKETRVRVNFKRKQLNIYGNAIKIDEVTEESYYQQFFSKVDKAIFIQGQKI